MSGLMHIKEDGNDSIKVVFLDEIGVSTNTFRYFKKWNKPLNEPSWKQQDRKFKSIYGILWT